MPANCRKRDGRVPRRCKKSRAPGTCFGGPPNWAPRPRKPAGARPADGGRDCSCPEHLRGPASRNQCAGALLLFARGLGRPARVFHRRVITDLMASSPRRKQLGPAGDLVRGKLKRAGASVHADNGGARLTAGGVRARLRDFLSTRRPGADVQFLRDAGRAN